MAVSTEFPLVDPIKIKNPLVKADLDKLKDVRGMYLRSASRELVALLTKQLCAMDCKKPQFTKDNPPVICACSHYVHANCATNKSTGKIKLCIRCQYKFEKLPGLGPRIPTSTNYGYSDEKGYCKDFPITKTVRDKCLKEFFVKILERKGYRCSGSCGNNKINGLLSSELMCHPRNNSVFIVDDGEGKAYNKYACVWCATRQFKEYSMRLIRDTDEPSSMLPQEKLKSVWFGDVKDLGFAYLQCTSCASELSSTEKDLHLHMECGHIVCKKCCELTEGRKEKEPGEIFIFCNYCDTSIPLKDIQLRASRVQTFIGQVKYSGECCDRCKHPHPTDNFPDPTETSCVWCTVEKKLANQ